jgi:hypothetical protein
MHATYGSIWKKPWHTKDGQLTRLGRDCLAVSGILWHLCHTSWFEYHTGSHLIYTRFPLQYQEMAQDGVRVYFEHTGPTTREAQPSALDPKIQEMVKDKILEVVKCIYLLTSKIKVNSHQIICCPQGRR